MSCQHELNQADNSKKCQACIHSGALIELNSGALIELKASRVGWLAHFSGYPLSPESWPAQRSTLAHRPAVMRRHWHVGLKATTFTGGASHRPTPGQRCERILY